MAGAFHPEPETETEPPLEQVTLRDGATLGYTVYGWEQRGNPTRTVPMVLITGRGSIMSDWGRLPPLLARTRPVLVYDHRGMGASACATPDCSDEITLETMADDAVALIAHVGWTDVDILGFSMGGLILQQLLLFPGRAGEAAPLPFRVHHVVLASTLCTPNERPVQRPAASTSTAPQSTGQPLTMAQKKAFIRPMVDELVSPKWIARRENQARYEQLLEGVFLGRRPGRVIMKQRAATKGCHFREELARIAPSTRVLVIHGREDEVVPYSKGEEMVGAVAHAEMVGVGAEKGQVPSDEYGHLWYEYFEDGVWAGVIGAFVDA